MARPKMWMRTPNDDIISFDTLDQAEQWLEEGLEDVRYFRTNPEVDDA